MICIRRVNDTTASAKVETRLDADRFARFRDAMRAVNAKWDPKTNDNLFRIDLAPNAVAGLKSKGLDVMVDAFLTRRAVAATAEVNRLAGPVQARLDALALAGITPRPFQIDGIAKLVQSKRYGLFDDMGLGKTFQLALAIPDGAAVVVVCPASLKFNWHDELRRFRPDLKLSILSGVGSFRWPTPGEVVILNYDILPGEVVVKGESGKRFSVEGIREPNPNLDLVLIADEAHLLKGSKARRSRLFKALKTYVLAASGRVWIATATEMPQGRPMELWNLLNCADLHKIAWPTGFGAFKSDFGASEVGLYGEIQWGKPNSRVVDKMRMISIKRLKEDVLPELPRKTYKTIRIEIDDKTKLVCDEVIAHLAQKGVSFDEVHDLVALTKVKGAGFELLSKAMSALATAKARPALEVVSTYEEAGIPLVVFAAHRAPVDLLRAREGWEVITGDTPVHDHRTGIPEDCTCRGAIVTRFQAGKLKGIAGTIQAMGFGLTLTHGSHVLRIDRDWSPEINRQAEDRVCRIGQTASSILITDIVADHPLDARLLEILIVKDETIASTTRAAAVSEPMKDFA